MIICFVSAILPAVPVTPSILSCVGLVLLMLLILHTLVMMCRVNRQRLLYVYDFLLYSSLGCVPSWMPRSYLAR